MYDEKYMNDMNIHFDLAILMVSHTNHVSNLVAYILYLTLPKKCLTLHDQWLDILMSYHVGPVAGYLNALPCGTSGWLPFSAFSSAPSVLSTSHDRSLQLPPSVISYPEQAFLRRHCAAHSNAVDFKCFGKEVLVINVAVSMTPPPHILNIPYNMLY